MPVPAGYLSGSTAAAFGSSASLIPPPPINTRQPGVVTSLLYSGSKFRGYQKSKGNSYDVEVVLQVGLRGARGAAAASCQASARMIDSRGVRARWPAAGGSQQRQRRGNQRGCHRWSRAWRKLRFGHLQFLSFFCTCSLPLNLCYFGAWDGATRTLGVICVWAVGHMPNLCKWVMLVVFLSSTLRWRIPTCAATWRSKDSPRWEFNVFW